MEFFNITIDWPQVTYNLSRLAFAYILALPIAWNREHEVRSAGLRTFPLVAVASCGFMLQGLSVLDSSDAEARVMYGIVTGIGFIGGKSNSQGQGKCDRNGDRGQYLEYRCNRYGSGLAAI